MKTLEIPAGGMPFTGDDLMWMQEGLVGAIKALCQPYLIDGKGIIAGMQLSIVSGSIVIAPGWIFMNNELLQFNGATIAGEDLTAHELYAFGEYDPAGNDVFADSIARDTYSVTTAKHRAYTSPGDQKVRLSDLNNYRINLRLASKRVVIYETATSKIILKRTGNVVNIVGYIGASTPINSQLGTTVAEEDRPELIYPIMEMPFPYSERVARLQYVNGVISVTGDIPTPSDGFDQPSFCLSYVV